MQSKSKNKILVADIGLASLLTTLNFPMVGLEKTNDNKRIDFAFASSKEVERTIEDFWQDKNVNIPIQTLFNNFRLLKNRLYALK